MEDEAESKSARGQGTGGALGRMENCGEGGRAMRGGGSTEGEESTTVKEGGGGQGGA